MLLKTYLLSSPFTPHPLSSQSTSQNSLLGQLGFIRVLQEPEVGSNPVCPDLLKSLSAPIPVHRERGHSWSWGEGGLWSCLNWLLPSGAKEIPNICEDEKEDLEQIAVLKWDLEQITVLQLSRKECFAFFFFLFSFSQKRSSSPKLNQKWCFTTGQEHWDPQHNNFPLQRPCKGCCETGCQP